MKHNININNTELSELCTSVRNFVFEKNFEACIKPICIAMEKFPHSPEPHNLMGIVFEKMGDHHTAMKHFRAAWALDPSYMPANHNLNTYGTFFTGGNCAFDESDVTPRKRNNAEIANDRQNLGTVGW